MHLQQAIESFDQFCTKLRYGKAQQENLYVHDTALDTTKEIPIHLPEQPLQNINAVYIGQQQISLTVPCVFDPITGIHSLLLPIQPKYAVALRFGQLYRQIILHACYCIHHMAEDEGIVEYFAESSHYVWTQAIQQSPSTVRLHTESVLYFPASLCSSSDSCLVIEYIL